MAVIAVDCGGTKVRAAHCDRPESPSRIAEAITPGHITDLPEVIAGLIGDPGRARAIGVGVAGLVDAGSGTLRWMPHRPGADVAVGAGLHDRFGLPVSVDNDANLTGLAEATLGSGVGYRMVLAVTVGTGIGGGLVVDGRIERGRGYLGEIGHMSVDPSGPRCACGRRGCWEALASGTALDRAARSLAAADPGFGASGVADGVALVTAAAGGHPAAVEAMHRVAAALGHGLASLVAVLDPDVIVVAGGVGAIGEPMLAPARRAMMEVMSGRDHRRETPVVAARFGADAGLVGAAVAAGGDL